PLVVTLHAAEIRRILGIDVPLGAVTRILTALEFKVEPAGGDALRVTCPPNRTDIQAGAADLIEEVARIHGYDRLPATRLAAPLPEQPGNHDRDREERLRDRLVDLGWQEVIPYALTTPEREAPLRIADSSDQSAIRNPQSAMYVRLLNPISSER